MANQSMRSVRRNVPLGLHWSRSGLMLARLSAFVKWRRSVALLGQRMRSAWNERCSALG